MPNNITTLIISAEPLLLSSADSAKLLGISRSLFLSMDSIGTLGPTPRKFGKRVLWSVAELRNWVANECPNREQWARITDDGNTLTHEAGPTLVKQIKQKELGNVG